MNTTDTGRFAAATVTAAPAIRHNVIRDAMAELFGTPPEGFEALGARVKALLGLGLRRNAAPAPGRGRGHHNGFADAMDVALALTLQRAFVPPVAAVALILDNRAAIDAMWSDAARGEPASLKVVIDALSHFGRPDARTGRFSEDPAGTLALAGRQESARRGRGMAPPRITIDLRALHAAATSALRRADTRRVGTPPK